MSGQRGFRWASASVTDVGTVRKVNEDACLELPSAGLWVVADGMGGHQAGDLASQMIVESLSKVEPRSLFSQMVDEVEDRMNEVNRRLLEIARNSEPPTTIGSTVVALLAHRRHCVCLWAGDSRIYRLRDSQLQQISQDHSKVEELIEQGLLLREDAEGHPEANVITRAVGAAKELYLDIKLEALQAGDQYLLCSDGLNKEVSDQEIASAMSVGDSAQICQTLVQWALERHCRDNVTALVVKFDEVS